MLDGVMNICVQGYTQKDNFLCSVKDTRFSLKDSCRQSVDPRRLELILAKFLLRIKI